MAGLLTPPTTPYKGQKQKRRAPLTPVDLNLPLPTNLHHDVPFSFRKLRTEQPASDSEPEPSPATASGWGKPTLLLHTSYDREKSCESFGEPIFLRETRVARPLTPPPEPLPVGRPTTQRETAKHSALVQKPRTADDGVKRLNTEACDGRRVEAVSKPASLNKRRVGNLGKTTRAKNVQTKTRKVLSWRAAQKLIFLDDDCSPDVNSWRAIQERNLRDEANEAVQQAPVQKTKVPLFLPWDSEDERCQNDGPLSEYRPLWPSDDETSEAAVPIPECTQQDPMVLDGADGREAAPRPKREPLFLPYSDSEDEKREPAEYVPMRMMPCVPFFDAEDNVSPASMHASKNAVNAPLSLDKSMDAADEMFGYRAPRYWQTELRSKDDVVMKDAGSSLRSKLKRAAVDDAEAGGQGSTKRRRVQIDKVVATPTRHTHCKVGASRTATPIKSSNATKNASAAAGKERKEAIRMSDVDSSDDEIKGISPNHPWLRVARKVAIVSPFY